MKARHVLAIMLALSTALWAQGQQPDCAETKTFWDQGCSTDTNCPPSDRNSCTRYSFTPACTGNYDLDCWVVCTGINCFHCKSCVVIYDDVFELAHCTTDSCNISFDCNHTAGSVALTAGHPYTVYVCLMPCPNTGDCDHCTSANGCEAWGCLRLGRILPCWQ